MLALIVAMSKNHVIGNKGVIPWKIKGEQKKFKELTTGKTVIMGKRSFEEIGKPLPNRRTIVISNTVNYEYDNCVTLGSLQEALTYIGTDEAFVAGGELLYKEALPLVDRMYITLIDMQVEGDTYFPKFNKEEFELVEEEKFEGEIPYQYLTYVRKETIGAEDAFTSSKQTGYHYIGQKDNLAIRIATMEDAKILCKWWNDGKVMAHAGFPKGLNTSIETIEEQIRKEDDNYHRLIIEIDTFCVGEMCYRIKDAIADIGIKICETAYQEHGYGTKALRLLIEYLFQEGRVNKIVLDTNLNNTRAQHVYENIGFQKIKVSIDAWKDQLGDLQSFVEYELPKENY